MNGYFALRVVQGQCTQILCLGAVHAQYYFFCHASAGHYAEVVVEKVRGIEAVGHLKGVDSHHSIGHSVERIGLDFTVFHIIAYHIPQLLEKTHKIRLNHHSGCGIHARVGVVGEFYAAVVLHCFNQHREVGARTWHIFEHNAAFHSTGTAQHTRHRHAVEQEITHSAGLFAFILDVVFVGRGITLNFHVKHVGNAIAIVIESASGERFTTRHFIVLPELPQIFACDAAISLQGVDNPDVFVD